MGLVCSKVLLIRNIRASRRSSVPLGAVPYVALRCWLTWRVPWHTLGGSGTFNMASQEQLELLKAGVAAWNEWRQLNPDAWPDLSNADLRCASLSGANLSHANLGGTDLSDAELTRADLSQVNLLGEPAGFTHSVNLRGATLSRADLTGADLTGSNLSHCKLNQARLVNATLLRTDLCRADLSEAILSCNLSYANLSYADLRGADLSNANLTDARMNGALLAAANLSHTILDGASLNEAVLSGTIFADVDLSAATGLETVTHEGASSIGIDTLYRSHGQIPNDFLRRAGVPQDVNNYLLVAIRGAGAARSK